MSKSSYSFFMIKQCKFCTVYKQIKQFFLFLSVVKYKIQKNSEELVVKFIFITDLDGTLLNNEDFDFTPIKSDLISLLEEGNIILPASSKSRAEINSFCDEVGRKLPFIYENGANRKR